MVRDSGLGVRGQGLGVRDPSPGGPPVYMIGPSDFLDSQSGQHPESDSESLTPNP